MNESSCKSSGKVYSWVLYLQCNQSQKEKPFKFLLHFISVVFDDEHFCHNNVYPVFKPNAAEVVVFELTLPSSGINLVPAYKYQKCSRWQIEIKMLIWLPYLLPWEKSVVYWCKKKFVEHPRLMVMHLMNGQNWKMQGKKEEGDVVINTMWGVTLKSRETFKW